MRGQIFLHIFMPNGGCCFHNILSASGIYALVVALEGMAGGDRLKFDDWFLRNFELF